MLRREGAVTIPDFLVVLLEYLAVGIGMSMGEMLIKVATIKWLNAFQPEGPDEPLTEDEEEEEEVKRKRKRRRAASSHSGGVSVVP